MVGTIEINGTGGILEGNLGTAAVNVNLDPVYGNFDGADSSLSGSGVATDFDSIWAGNGGCAAAWIYPKSRGEGNSGKIMGKYSWELGCNDLTGTNISLMFVHYWADSNGAWNSPVTIPLNAWTHVAIVYDSDATGNNPILYLNGVATAMSEDSSPAGALTSDASSDLIVGNRATSGGGITSTKTFDGYIMDVKIYKNVAVTATNVAKMASKINVDKDAPDMPTSGLQGWFPLTADDDDDSGEGNNLSAANMGSIVYDAFSVNVQDGGDTTTDGAVTVTQGKLECLSLSSVDFDGDNDYISFSAFNPGNDFSAFAWVNPDELTASDEAIFGGPAPRKQFDFNNSDELRYYDEDLSPSSLTYAISEADYENKWSHVGVTRSGTTTTLYIDGVAVVSGEQTGTTNNNIAYIGYTAASSQIMDGKIRDAKIFDYGLSTDQAASLYSGSYNVTPLHWWKLDEGHATTALANAVGAFTDSGTGTAAHGQGVSLVDASCVNGTLDLDSTLTIAANGTLSAPRGNLDFDGNFDINGTFTHNNGKVRFVGSGSHVDFTPNNATFFDIDLATGSGHDFILKESITILGTLDLTGSTDYWIASAVGAAGNITMTMGDADNQATIESHSADRFRPYPDAARELTITGGSSLKPCLVTGNDWKWDYQAGAAGIKLANMDFQVAVDTDTGTGNAVKIILTGDCEFDAVTVSSGDTLDLNGQRAFFDGALTLNSSSNFDFGGGMVYVNDNFNNVGVITLTDAANGTLVQDFAGGCSIRHPTNIGTVFINSGSTSSNPATAYSGIGKFIVGGTHTANDLDNSCTDVTISTGGTLTAGSSTITCSGDFTTSGGLLGASAITLDGGDTGSKRVNCSATVLNGATTFTIEAWVKPDVNDENFQTIVCARDGGTDGVALSILNQTVRLRINSDDLVTGNVITTAGKWYHVVGLRDSGNVTKIYVDGKLVKEGSSTASISISQDLKIGCQSYNNANAFDGSIDEVRIWNDERTKPDIRTNMFSEITSVGSDLILYTKFNEGTGNPVDSGTNTRTLTATGDIWAGAGDFDYDQSTLKMTGTSTFTYNGDELIYNLIVNAPLTLKGISGGDNDQIRINGDTFTMNSSGTITSTNEESIKLKNNLAGGTLTFDAPTTNLANLYKLNCNHSSGTMSIPELTTPRLYCTTTASETRATGDLTITDTIFVDGSNIFNANGNTIAVKRVDIDGGTLNLSNSALNFSVTASGDSMNMESTSTLLTGNTTITGYGTGTGRTGVVFPAAGGFEVVGDVKWLRLTGTNGELTVVGAVIDCESDTSDDKFIQWHHTLDTQQLLDADEAGDDDMKLPRPSLDNALQLQTGG